MDDENIYNRVNIDTDLNVILNSSPHVLNTEPCVNISRLKSFNCQNFTAILNNPEVYYYYKNSFLL